MPKQPILKQAKYFSDPNLDVVVDRQPTQGAMGAHRHDFVELTVVLSGKGVHSADGTRFELQAGDVMVINRSRSHGYENTRSLNIVNLLIREKIFRDAEKEFSSLAGYHALFTLEPVRWRQHDFSSRLRLNAADLHQVSQWIDQMELETQRIEEGGRLLARAWLFQIIGLLSRRYGQHAEDAPQVEMRLGRVLSWIEQHFAKPLSLDGLAERAAMSNRTFLRQFRAATGLSPIDYLIRVRIRHAREWLEVSGRQLNITEIAQRCGFEDSNYFSRQFRRVTGIAPRDCRR